MAATPVGVWWARLVPGHPAVATDPLYDRIYADETLTRAWKHVRRVHCAGVDGVTVRAFEREWPRNMADLAQTLRQRNYHPLPMRRFLLPDAAKRREVGVLALRDRIVQRAVYEVVLPRFEAQASPASFAYRPGLSHQQAIDRLAELRMDGYLWVVNADIHAFFDEIDQRRALGTFRCIVQNDEITNLVEEWLTIGSFRPRGDLHRGRELAVSGRSSEPEWLTRLGTALPELARLAGKEVRRHVAAAGEAEEPVGEKVDVNEVSVALLVALLGVIQRMRERRGEAASLPHPAARLAGSLLAAIGGLTLATVGARSLLPKLMRRPSDPLGLSQGSVLAPLLANAYLARFDQALTRRGLAFVRYADNLAVACHRQEEALRARRLVERELGRLGLRLNDDQAAVLPYDAGFTFLGARFPRYHSHRQEPLPEGEQVARFNRSPYWLARRAMAMALPPVRRHER